MLGAHSILCLIRYSFSAEMNNRPLKLMQHQTGILHEPSDLTPGDCIVWACQIVVLDLLHPTGNLYVARSLHRHSKRDFGLGILSLAAPSP